MSSGAEEVAFLLDRGDRGRDRDSRPGRPTPSGRSSSTPSTPASRSAATQRRPSDIVVVAIDDVTFSDLDEQWPFPRSLHGGLIDRLREAGARTIAYDVQFTEPTTRREDNALIRAVAPRRNVVLATTEVDERGRTQRLRRRGGAAQRSARGPGTR